MLNAQVEFAPLGSEWIVNGEYEAGLNPFKSTIVITSEKDTIIDGLEFRKVGSDYYYQEENKVWYLYNDTLRLIYDFGVELNDTIDFEMLVLDIETSKNTFVVSKIDSIEFNNGFLKRFTCDLIDGDLSFSALPYIYLEKIGSERVLLENLADIFLVYEPERLRCFIENGEVYKTPWFLSFGNLPCDVTTSTEENNLENSIYVFPNPATDWIRYTFYDYVPKDAQLRLYDMSGQMMKSQRIQQGVNKVQLSEFDAATYIYELTDHGKLLKSGKVFKVD